MKNKDNQFTKTLRFHGVSKRDLGTELNLSQPTINKIFTERFGSRERKIMELKSQMENQFNKLKQ